MATLKESLLRLGSTVEKSAADAVRITIAQSTAFTMSFDGVESAPWVQGTNGMLIISGARLENSTETIEEILAAQTQTAVDVLQKQLNEGIRKALG